MCAACLHALLCSRAVCWSPGVSVWLQSHSVVLCAAVAQLSLHCYDVIGCWLWNAWGNENLIELKLSAAHFYCISCVVSSTVVQFFLVTAAVLADPWQINLCLVSNDVFKFTSDVPMSSFVVANVFIAFSVLTEDSIPESASCWGPQGPPASSVEMLHVSTRAAILRQHHQQW